MPLSWGVAPEFEMLLVKLTVARPGPSRPSPP